MTWMPAPDEATCQLVAHAIYRLTRPAGSTPSDTTRYAFGWRQDAHGTWWMDMDPDTVLPVHAERSTETADTLALFVQAGSLSQASAAAIAALVQERVAETEPPLDSEGNPTRPARTVTLGEVIPPEWTAQMVAEPEWPVETTD